VLGFKPTADEGQDAEGGTVQPVRVVRDENQRYRVGHFADELKGGGRNAVRIRLEVYAQTECSLEGLPLRLGLLRHRPDDRTQQLVQARKSQLGFCFNSDGDQRSGALRVRSPAHSLEQHRLTDAGLAPHDESSPTFAKPIYQRVQNCGLLLALDQLGAGVDPGRPAHRPSMTLLVMPARQTPGSRQAMLPGLWARKMYVSTLTADAPTVAGLALQVKDLRVSYGSKRAVDGVSLEINEGEIFGLLGPNGAGKTSTLSAIEGLLQPTSGSILIRQIDARADPGLAKALIGVQLQSTSFQSELKISEIVKLYAGLYGVPLTKPAILDRLTEIHLGDEASRRFSQLSGGQQKRLALLIATVHDPPLVLLDEPTSGLDPQARRQLWDRIEGIRKSGRSILLTTHSMEEAQAVCDRVAIMDNGKILTVDTPAGLIEKHKNDPDVLAVARGQVTLEDVFIGLTGRELRE
jgi:ABC-2 type transport system ATP-binding protein